MFLSLWLSNYTLRGPCSASVFCLKNITLKVSSCSAMISFLSATFSVSDYSTTRGLPTCLDDLLRGNSNRSKDRSKEDDDRTMSLSFLLLKITLKSTHCSRCSLPLLHQNSPSITLFCTKNYFCHLEYLLFSTQKYRTKSTSLHTSVLVLFCCRNTGSE